MRADRSHAGTPLWQSGQMLESPGPAEGGHDDATPAARAWLTRNLAVLSGVSFLQDAASDLLYPILPIFITTFSRLRATGAGAPIWLKVGPLEPGESALTAPKMYCFDCFSPKPVVPRKPGLTLYSSG